MMTMHALLQPAPAVPVLVIGAGLMGVGIAQVAAQAGHGVWLHDSRPGAAEAACQGLASTFETLASKGKLSAETARAASARLHPVQGLADAASAALVIEAIVEQLDAKQQLLRDLESLVSPACVLASNTSSISITALARGMRHPGRLVGMHFFNPVPLMKLVEVVAGLQTDGAAVDAVHTLAGRWGKVAVHARSTPGFIVNRIARPFYAETLGLLQEQAGTPVQLDACLRGAGFRMGACELTDLIGHDTNFAVTESVYRANFDDRRFTPSLVQRELVDGGLYGRKSGQGFYDYRAGAAGAALPLPAVPHALPACGSVTLHGTAPWLDRWDERLQQQGFEVRRADGGWTGLACGRFQLRLTDGRCAGEVAVELAGAGAQVPLAVVDLPLQALMGGSSAGALAYSVPDPAAPDLAAAAAGWLKTLGLDPVRLADVPGLVVARTVAMLVNEAADAVLQGVCTAEAADTAMTLGVNYPAGPHAWQRAWGAAPVVQVLEQLDRHYRGERYRVSPALRRACWSATQAGFQGSYTVLNT